MRVGEWQQREEYYNTKRREKGDSGAEGRGCFPAHPSVLLAEQQPVIKAAIHLRLFQWRAHVSQEVKVFLFMCLAELLFSAFLHILYMSIHHPAGDRRAAQRGYD